MVYITVYERCSVTWMANVNSGDRLRGKQLDNAMAEMDTSGP